MGYCSYFPCLFFVLNMLQLKKVDASDNNRSGEQCQQCFKRLGVWKGRTDYASNDVQQRPPQDMESD